MAAYPWYEVVADETIEQGDIFREYPVFLPQVSSEIVEQVLDGKSTPDIPVQPYALDVIVVSQSCDLLNRKIDTVIVCPLWSMKELEETLGLDGARKERMRRGYEPSWHLINGAADAPMELSAVEFKRIHTTPKQVLETVVTKHQERIRLLPPYREHLSQAFARYFMRVGLPVDIPKFV